MPLRLLALPAERRRRDLRTRPGRFPHHDWPTRRRSDLAFIRQHRWDYNRLGVAIQRSFKRSYLAWRRASRDAWRDRCHKTWARAPKPRIL